MPTVKKDLQFDNHISTDGILWVDKYRPKSTVMMVESAYFWLLECTTVGKLGRSLKEGSRRHQLARWC